MVSASTPYTTLDNLLPETRYQILVYAGYRSGEGDSLEEEEITDGMLILLEARISHSIISRVLTSAVFETLSPVNFICLQF